MRLAILVLLAATASRAFEPERDPDDPRGRLEARAALQAKVSPEEQFRALTAAAREVRRARATSAVAQSAWVNLGPADGKQLSPLLQLRVDSGRVNRIVPHPTDPDVLYVATSGGGVWKTFNAQSSGAVRWSSITGFIGSQAVGSFALDPQSPDTLYLGLGDPFDVHTPGFYTSLDGGQTWSDPVKLAHGASLATSTRDIGVDPQRAGVVVVATDAGLFVSQQGGFGDSFVWKAGGDCWSVAALGSDTWLATCDGAVLRSIDGGASFAAIPLPTADVGRMTLAAAPGDLATPDRARVYLLAEWNSAAHGASDQGDVFRSDDGGRTFHSLGMNATSACAPACPQPAYWTNDQPDLDVLHDQAWYNQAIAVDPRDRDRVFIGGNLAMIRSQDGGQTWRVMTDWLPGSPLSGGAQRMPYVHADWHAMAIATPGAAPVFYGGTDGGLFRSQPALINGRSYDVFTADPTTDTSSDCYDGACLRFDDRLNRGLATHLAYSLATDLHDSSNPVLIGGLQDNGTRLRAAAAPTQFNQVYGGDGFGVGIGISNSSAAASTCRGRWGSLLLGSIYGVVVRSVDCGTSFAPAMNGICGSPTMFTGDCNVDYGANFYMKLASDQADPSGQTLLTVINRSNCDDVNGARPAKCTPGAAMNNVFVTHDGGFSWHLANGSVGHFPSPLRFVGTNPLQAGQWVVADDTSVWTTVDGGAHWTHGAALPGPVTGAAFEGTSGLAIWAVSRRGGARVFRSADGGASFSDRTGTLTDGAGGATAVAVDPGAPSVVYLGTENGLYRTQDAGVTWQRHGSGLPLVEVTEINVALDSSALRISTFGRGFWELNGSPSAPAGVYGNGDFDHNQLIDGFDLVREAALLGATPQQPDYDATGNLTGATNGIDAADLAALAARLGARP